MTPATNGTSPIKRQRRCRGEMDDIRELMRSILEERHPMTVRQMFYQLVTRGAIAKTEAQYKGTVCRLLADMRKDGSLPFAWLADNTRWMRKPTTYRSLKHGLRTMQQYYRRDLWNEQDVYCEIWLEKEALAGVLCEVTEEWDVRLMVTRGYPSLSFLHSAAETIRHVGKPAHLFYVGDRDPSGIDIPRVVESEIRKMAPDADLTFTLAAVTPEQIDEYELPTRPTKKTDTRSKSFDGESVEVDALDPDVLKSICANCITQHIDHERLRQMRIIEECERKTLESVLDWVN